MENREERDSRPATPQTFRNIFAIIMIIVYVGVGLILLFNWFNVVYDPSWNLLRWIGGPVLIVYGLFRAWRQFKGYDSPV